VATFEETRDAFADRLFDASVDAMDVFCVYLGDRLGLYRELEHAGPLTPGQLAENAGIDGRYAREWLEQQAATGILEVDDASKPEDERRFSLPAAHAAALTDPESPYAMAAVCRSLVAIGGTMPDLARAFRTGDGVVSEGEDGVEAQGDFNRAWLVRSFATEYLPSIPDVHRRLQKGARVADVACGVGWAAISIARAYPMTVIDGIDVDAPSIDLARRNADDAGVADRVTFQARDASDPSPGARYDVAVIIEALHDMSRPVDVLSAVRSILNDDGTLIVADERVADAFHAPADLRERLFYGYSVTSCLPGGLMEKPSAGTGTVLRRGRLERYAAEAGFRTTTVLPIEHEMLRFYRLDP
jgi:2-polyprenyl-3-methyl-5-hydroxy-6-metoxy-1,4-benzoquinol methylase